MPSLLPGVEPSKAILGSNLLRYQLQPAKSRGLDRSECEAPLREVPSTEAIQRETRAGVMAQEGLTTAMAAMAERKQKASANSIQAPDCLQHIDRQTVEITFLGTASSCPSKYRNVTAIYVDFFQRGGMLLDCGEDALGQLKRRYGCADAERRIRELRCIWISHMHADHHGGLYRLLELRTQLLGPDVTPILVIGPPPLFRVLRLYQEVVPLPFHLLLSSHLLPHYSGRAPPRPVLNAFSRVKRQLGLKSLQPFEVHHIPHSYGIVLEGDAGWRVVFSGDTRPCAQTVEAARGCSLLIHEATFENDMADDARKKRHSTSGEALSIAEQAQAYRVLLTHFSTRYPKMPELDLEAHPHMAVAMDFMSINLGDLQWLPSVTPALAALFKYEEEEWEHEEDETKA
uniref:ribonuclease Z n=1 Tax=Dunaliella tertiolecta TaxID=3047 RepID=A0A7S3VJG7_DUNTE